MSGTDLRTLSVQQLQGLAESLESDVTQLTESLQMLQRAIQRYHTSGTALEALDKEVEGKPMLVPLTSSLYVPGRLGATDKVLLDVGTGYFVEKSPESGVEYCRLKVSMLKQNMEKLIEVINTKRKQTMSVNDVLMKKMEQGRG